MPSAWLLDGCRQRHDAVGKVRIAVWHDAPKINPDLHQRILCQRKRLLVKQPVDQIDRPLGFDLADSLAPDIDLMQSALSSTTTLGPKDT